MVRIILLPERLGVQVSDWYFSNFITIPYEELAKVAEELNNIHKTREAIRNSDALSNRKT